MLHSENFAQVAAALATAQGQFPAIPRDRAVTVKLRDKPNGSAGGSYTFKYAPLETILEKTRKPLADAGLCLVQAVMLDDANVEMLRTTLVHSSGEWFANEVPMFVGTGDNKSQAWSSGSTYSRRYGVTMILCVAADEDDDGNGGDQDQDRPDYHRQEQATHRGSFPRQGGGRSEPRPPQRRQDRQPPPDRPVDYGSDPAPSTDVDAKSPWGQSLTDGQRSIAKQRALAAGLTDSDVLERFGVIDSDTYADHARTLKRLADEALDNGA